MTKLQKLLLFTSSLQLHVVLSRACLQMSDQPLHTLLEGTFFPSLHLRIRKVTSNREAVGTSFKEGSFVPRGELSVPKDRISYLLG